MKKIIALVVIGLTLFVGCSSNDATYYIGLNAEIVEINTQTNGFMVRPLDADGILGEEYYVDLGSDEINYMYVDNHTGEIEILSCYDFILGDEITLDIDDVIHHQAIPTRVQLTTQRR